MRISRVILSVWDQEELHYIAEELIIALRYDYFRYDDEGNNLLDACQSEEERSALWERMLDMRDEFPHNSFLDFRDNEELQKISFSEALEMPLETIKEKYLKDVLPKARGIMRKGTMINIYPYEVSDELPDSFLDDLLALRWRENLKLWTIQWEQDKERSGEKRDKDEASEDV